jgi:DNA-directed RNA polymerase subunit RPC12/RpoP
MLNNGFQLPTEKQICPECKEDWFEDLVKGREVECPYCHERVVPERGVLH